MHKNQSLLTPDSKKLILADFFWNFGRTLPHAILTIYLLEKGLTLTKISMLQSIFMITSIIFEFPSGIISDIFSRKIVYQISIIFLFISYLLIGLFSEYFLILCLAYFLYGSSIALKSGTLEANVIIEYRNKELDIKNFSIKSSYAVNFSSILGGVLGGFLYKFLNGRIYFLSLSLFFISFAISILTYSNFQDSETKKESSLYDELKIGFSLLIKHKNLPFVLLLAIFSALFIQPFFQFWQVLYKEVQVPVVYFGLAYLLFQFCGILASFLFSRIKINLISCCIGLALIPLIYFVGYSGNFSTLICFPITIVIFNIYNLFLDVIIRKVSPESFISSFFSLINTIANIASVLSLMLMTLMTNIYGVRIAYLILFILFSISSAIILFIKKDLFSI